MISQEPLVIYYVAPVLDWKDEARLATRWLTYSWVLSIYRVELEMVPARDCFRQPDYHHLCQKLIDQVLQQRHPASYGGSRSCDWLLLPHETLSMFVEMAWVEALERDFHQIAGRQTSKTE
jgi:hypothetical protein